MVAVKDGTITKRTRGYLPHWERDAETYFVTFRLWDSLPAAALQEILKHRRMFDLARRSGRKLLPIESATLHRLSSRKVEAYLDAGSGECLFNRPELAMVVADALRHFDGERYQLEAWCVMPNHVHVLSTLGEGESLAKIVGGWKSVSAHRIVALLGRRGPIWQAESYDHLVRDEREFDRAVDYIRNNPIRAGLRDWPWVYVKKK